MASVADVVEELANHGDEHQQHRIVIENNIFYNSESSCNTVNNNDVQSMDAIERKDFINEQEAPGTCFLGNSSLIINGTNGDEPRLNLDLLGNTISQQMEQIAAMSEENSGKRSAETLICTQNNRITSTPTTSRTKRSRLNNTNETKTNSINLAKSLEKRKENSGQSSSWNDEKQLVSTTETDSRDANVSSLNNPSTSRNIDEQSGIDRANVSDTNCSVCATMHDPNDEDFSDDDGKFDFSSQS